MSDTTKRAEAPPPEARANVWALTWRFLKRGRPYAGRIFITIIVIFIASGAKTLQTWLIKPVIDGLRDDKQEPEQRAEQLRARLKLTEPQTVQVRELYAAEGKAGEDLDKGGREKIRAVLTDEQRVEFEKLAPKPIEWKEHLGLIAAVAIGLSVLMFLFGYLRDALTNWLTSRVIADLRNDIVRHLSYLPLRFFHDRKSGDLISRVSNDVTLTEAAANFYFDDAIVHPVMIIWAVGIIFTANPTLAVAALVFFPFYVLPLAWIGRKMRRARKRSMEHLGDMTGTMVQTFGGIKVVKAFNMEPAQNAEFRGHNESYFQKLMAAIRRKALSENLAHLFIGIAIAVMLVGGGFLLARKVMSPGDMAIFGIGIAIINTSIRELSKSYNRLLDASTGCERVFELLDQKKETEHDDGAELAELGRGVDFERVTFAYDTEPVLRDVSLRVVPGEVVALVGPTGSGKTTLCDLLCRFYDPTGGSIFIDGRDLRTLKRSSLLKHVAVVAQDTFLFNTTIAENILYGKPGASQDEIENAAKIANIHDFIITLQNGYLNVVGERGAKLSGGQRQRLAIARAVLKNPDILILDEATSALDAESEKLVQDAIDKLIHSSAKKRITFVIAHRLSTVRDADRIVVLKEGRIVEMGTHDELVERNGVYAGLYRTQFAA